MSNNRKGQKMQAILISEQPSQRGKWHLKFEAENGLEQEGYYYVTPSAVVDANGYEPFQCWHVGNDGLRECRPIIALNRAAHKAALAIVTQSLSADHWRAQIREWDAAEEARVAALPEPPDYDSWLAATFPTADSRWGQGMTGRSCRDVYNALHLQPRTMKSAPKAWYNALERALQAGL